MLLKTYKSLINPDDLCFDIGANMGVYTRAMSSLGSKVVSLEPNPAYAEKLKAIPGNITIIQKAVSDCVGNSTFYIHDTNMPLSTLKRSWTGIDHTGNVLWREITVETITLNDLIEQFGTPAFCKIDVEGFESKILSVLKYKIPILSIEFSALDRENFLTSIQFIKKFGDFKYNFTIDFHGGLALPDWCDDMDTIENAIYSSGAKWGDVIIKYK